MANDNAAGHAALDGMIARIKALRSLATRAAPAVAQRVEQLLDAQIGAGQTPDGAAWAPRKDGGRALVHAAKAITVRAVGTVVLVRLSGPEAIHNQGTKKYPRRQIIPGRSGLPTTWGQALKDELGKVFRQTIGGA